MNSLHNQKYRIPALAFRKLDKITSNQGPILSDKISHYFADKILRQNYVVCKITTQSIDHSSSPFISRFMSLSSRLLTTSA